MNIQLSHEFITLEVQIALKQMAPLKAPSPDSMPPIFYQNYWDLIGSDVSQTIPSYLNSASLPHPLNHTFITLIPKVKSPVSVTKYQPISLYNVFYKIFSKVLANRFKKILPSIITEHQSAFTKNFLISDNILIAFETIHSIWWRVKSVSYSILLNGEPKGLGWFNNSAENYWFTRFDQSRLADFE